MKSSIRTICQYVAKTQYSLSDNPAFLGRPEGFVITVSDVRISNGAGFVVIYTGDIMTMPGLPRFLPQTELMLTTTVKFRVCSD